MGIIISLLHGKADSDLRICLNPTHLNKAIRRDHYRTPTLEEITYELAGSTKFTKVDGSSSYYCIVLDYESSLLTTFNTHRGRFHCVRLPFGLTCAQDIFQRMMDQILDRCEGVIGITDDIIIHGKDDAEHDRRLHKFMKVARETWTGTEQEESVRLRATLSSSLAVFMTSMEPTQIHQRSVPSRRCLPHRTKESFRASLEW